MNVLVLGAGSVGLWSARELLQAGAEVRLWTREDTLETTSAVAAAIWYPYEVRPEERVLPWALRSLERYQELAQVTGTGITMVRGTELSYGSAPDWLQGLESFEELSSEELPDTYRAGWRLTVPVIETPIHLQWLRGEVLDLGASIERREVTAPEELDGQADVIVNATGLGAGKLFSDPEVHPIQGQIVRLPNPGLRSWSFFQPSTEDMGYVIPRSKDVVLGGTAVHGDWSRTPDEHTAEAIFEKCTRHEAMLAGLSATEATTVVGLRPGRTEVRLEHDRTPGGTRVIHNYGHGGAGITLSAGCAEEVCRLVMEPDRSR